jgi:hypothetical protein
MHTVTEEFKGHIKFFLQCDYGGPNTVQQTGVSPIGFFSERSACCRLKNVAQLDQ